MGFGEEEKNLSLNGFFLFPKFPYKNRQLQYLLFANCLFFHIPRNFSLIRSAIFYNITQANQPCGKQGTAHYQQFLQKRKALFICRNANKKCQEKVWKKGWGLGKGK